LKAAEIYELYVRLSSSNNEPDEAGSDGPHEGIVEALLKDRVAAPVIQIDRLRGEFAGGRWILANFSGTLGVQALRLLAEIASQGASRFDVKPSFAVTVRMKVPRSQSD
jgi:phosphomannomutase